MTDQPTPSPLAPPGTRRHRHGKHAAPRRARAWRIAGYVACGLLTFAGALLLFTAIWVQGQFGYISVRQFLTHVPTTAAQVGTVPTGFVGSYVLSALTPAVATTALLLELWVIASKLSEERRQTKVRRAVPWLAVTASGVLLFAGATDFSDTIGLRNYVSVEAQSGSMEAYYAEPVVLSPPDGTNLIIIYLESMDDAFGDEEMIGENPLESLQAATEDWRQLDRLSHYPSGGWTMPGIVSTQCGLPKRGPESDEDFFAGATCLGDVLAENGYTTVWMGGADGDFEQKTLFLTSHGFQTVMDRQYWSALGEPTALEEGWGLSDQRLFELARSEVSELHAQDTPFFLGMITLDNHDPIVAHDYCPSTSDDLTISTMRCQSDIVAGFIEYLEDTGVMEDTVVVVMADHSIHAQYHEVSSYQSKLSADDQENIPLFNRIYAPTDFEFGRTVDNQLHMYPTILELLGVELEDGRAGLGVSLLNTPAETARFPSIVGMDTSELGSLLEGSLPEGIQVPPEETQAESDQSGT